MHEAQAALLRRIRQEANRYDLSDSSDGEVPPEDESSSSEDEEDEKENAHPDGEWSGVTHDIPLPPFASPSGSALPLHHGPSELDYVEQFITPSLVSIIATNTNLHAASKGAAAGWTTSVAEVWRFLAVNLFMGIVKLPYLHLYWEGDWRESCVVNTFTRDRFKELLRYFHIGEPTPPGVKPTVIDQIKPLHDLCLVTFRAYFLPPLEKTVDESMIRFKGRSRGRRSSQANLHPVGYKVYTLASHGYLLAFHVTEAKVGTLSTRPASITE